jgi:hypothetical protein
MKLKTLAWTQIILGALFLIDGLYGMLVSDRGLIIRFSQEYIVLGLGLFAFLTGLYNLKNKK